MDNQSHRDDPISYRSEIESEIVALELEAKTVRWNITELSKSVEANRSHLLMIDSDLSRLRERLEWLPE